MAQAGVLLDKDQLNCSVCLDVLKDPVTTPCGHNYCSACIQRYWDQDELLAVYSCPQCRQSFSPRPLLGRNTVLADVLERFRNTGLHAATDPAAAPAPSAPGQTLAGPEDVECDVCTGGKNKAVKSCLVCLASYCEGHVQPHYQSAAFKKHKLVPAAGNLRETLCPLHDKLLEVYCRSDRECICYLCLTDRHKGHDTVLVEAETQERKTHLTEMKQTSQQRIQEREKEVHEIKQAIMCLTRSTRVAIEESDKVFSELIRSIELKRFEVRELMRAQEKTAVRHAQELLEKIQRGTAELRKRDAELEELSRCKDHIQFLQSFRSLPAPPVTEDLPSVSVNPSLTFDLVMAAVSDFSDLLQEVCQGGFVSIYERVRDVAVIDSPEPGVQPEMSSPEPGAQTNVHMEDTPAPTAGLDQAPMGLNPFLSSPPAVPTFGGFAFSPFGSARMLLTNSPSSSSKLSSGSRLRHLQRRSQPRRNGRDGR